MAMGLLILTGCAPAPAEAPVLARLERPLQRLAVALAGEDVPRMRATGRDVIAIYDAGVGSR